MNTNTYISLVSQHQNLGDLIIRKNALDELRKYSNVVVLTKGMPKEYISAFDLDSNDTKMDSILFFQFHLALSALRRRANLLLAPGPVVLEASWSRRIKAALVLLNSILIRMGGGRVVSAGRSFRGNDKILLVLERCQKRVSSTYTVRDYESEKLIPGATVAPDMAFSAPFDGGSDRRKYIAVSLRKFSADTRRDLVDLITIATHCSLEVVLVSQVKFDEQLHDEVAEAFRIRHVAWSGASHAEQLEIVRAVYRDSVFVVSNRLHALIFGAEHGAIPVEADPGIQTKISATLHGRLELLKLQDLALHFEELAKNSPKLRDSLRSDWNEARRNLSEVFGIPK